MSVYRDEIVHILLPSPTLKTLNISFHPPNCIKIYFYYNNQMLVGIWDRKGPQYLLYVVRGNLKGGGESSRWDP
jgi:hypothetical protein